jgi:hypothetical protein
LDRNQGYFCVNTAYIIVKEETWLLGFLNSSLTTYFYSKLSATVRGGYLRFIDQYIRQIPIAKPTESQQREIEERVEKIHDLRNLRKVFEDKQSNLPKVTELEREIDLLVYHLYNLTLEEVHIIDPAITEEEYNKYKL